MQNLKEAFAENIGKLWKSHDVKELKSEIISSLKNIGSDPELLARFSEFMSRFHNYSINNRILIFLQKPDAVQVAGYGTWKQLGRFVKKGEQGIRIFAPLIKTLSRKDEEEEENQKSRKRILRGFRIVSVFDYLQTGSKDGKDIEIPSFGKLEVESPKEIYQQLKQLAQSNGLKVVETAMRFSAAGATDGSCIWINRLSPVAGKCSTMLHELAHVFLEHSGDRKELETTEKEVEAELTAFLAGTSLGLPRGSYEYIQGWLKGQEIEDDVIETALKTAERLVAQIKPVSHHESGRLVG